jgi:lipocalin-like protein
MPTASRDGHSFLAKSGVASPRAAHQDLPKSLSSVAARVPSAGIPLIDWTAISAVHAEARVAACNKGRNPMNRFGVLSLCAATGLGLALLSVTAFGQQKSLKEQIVGSWIYVSSESVAPDGKRTSNYAPPGPAGLWIFGSDGRFMSLVVAPDIPKFASGNRATGTAEENKAVVQGSIATFGRYAVNEADHTLILNIERSTYPNWNGTEQKRPITITGDELKYVVPEQSFGGRGEVALRRAK